MTRMPWSPAVSTMSVMSSMAVMSCSSVSIVLGFTFLSGFC